MRKFLVSGVAAICLAATTGLAAAQVTDSVDLTLTIAKAAPTLSVSGLDDITFSFDGNQFSNGHRDTFCFYSDVSTFSVQLDGVNDANSTFYMASPGQTSINYIIGLTEMSGSTQVQFFGEMTPGVPISIDGSSFIADETCSEFDNLMVATSFTAYGNPNDIDTVYAGLTEGVTHTFTDTLTMTFAPLL